MRLTNYDFELNFTNESVETLLLMAVLGRETDQHAALSELKRRRAVNNDVDSLDDAYMTNLSGIC